MNNNLNNNNQTDEDTVQTSEKTNEIYVIIEETGKKYSDQTGR